MSDGDPSVSCIEREPSQEAFDKRSEDSYPIRVGIVGSKFCRVEKGINPPGDVVGRVGRRTPVRMEGFTQCGFFTWAELVMEELRSNRSNGIGEIRRLTWLGSRRVVQQIQR